MSFIAATADPSEITDDRPTPPLVTPSDEVIGQARAAAVEVAGSAGSVGNFAGATAEDEVAVSLSFVAQDRGYRGWYWSVTVAVVEQARPTISEVVLLPGAEALLAPAWVPWDQRIRAGDVGAGDLLATAPDDPRLVPGYLDSDDPAIAEVSYEFGFGRVRVLGREGREEAAQRWHDGPFGPDSAIAAAAPATCGSCAFYVPLAGLLGMAMGACANEYSPADGRVVDVEFGCGAHSETVIEAPLISAATDTVVDELTLEVHARPVPAARPDEPADALPTQDVDAAEATETTVAAVEETAQLAAAVETVEPAAVVETAEPAAVVETVEPAAVVQTAEPAAVVAVVVETIEVETFDEHLAELQTAVAELSGGQSADAGLADVELADQDDQVELADLVELDRSQAVDQDAAASDTDATR